MNAHLINRGLLPDFARPEEFSLLEEENDAQSAAKIVSLYAALTDELGEGEVQVLSPMHKDAAGVANLNRRIQERVNPPDEEKNEILTPRHTLREGDKVMQVRNNYEKEVFNGDIGWVRRIAGKNLAVFFPDVKEGSTVNYEAGELDELQLAYAMSVHKSQGSEYPVVILSFSRSHHIFLQRNLLYTAITRARERVLIVGQKKAVQAAVLNDRMRKRYSLLAERLREIPLC